MAQLVTSVALVPGSVPADVLNPFATGLRSCDVPTAGVVPPGFVIVVKIGVDNGSLLLILVALPKKLPRPLPLPRRVNQDQQQL